MLRDYEEDIKVMLSFGFTVEEISVKLGYQKGYLYNYFRKHGYRCQAREHRIEMLKEYAKTHTASECAKKFSCAYATIRNMCKQNNISTIRDSKKPGINAERDEMISFLAEKFTYESIGKVFGLTRERVRQIYESSHSKCAEI